MVGKTYRIEKVFICSSVGTQLKYKIWLKVRIFSRSLEELLQNLLWVSIQICHLPTDWLYLMGQSIQLCIFYSTSLLLAAVGHILRILQSNGVLFLWPLLVLLDCSLGS